MKAQTVSESSINWPKDFARDHETGERLVVYGKPKTNWIGLLVRGDHLICQGKLNTVLTTAQIIVLSNYFTL